MGNQIKKVGFVYSGGLSRGAGQIAFVKEIIDKIGYDKIEVISASSIGALNAFATSMNNIDELIDFYWNLDCDSTKHFMKKIRNDLYNDVFNRVEGDKLNFDTYVTGTRMAGLNCEYFCLNKMSRDDIKTVINVSMSYPIVNGPIKFKRRHYIDGGATDNVPVYPLSYYKDLDMILIIHNYPKLYPPEFIYETNPNAVIVDVDVTLPLPKGKFTSFSLTKDSFRAMIENGRKTGKEFANYIFQDMDKDNVQKRCYEFTRANLEARKDKGGDGLMNFVSVLNALYLLKESLD